MLPGHAHCSHCVGYERYGDRHTCLMLLALSLTDLGLMHGPLASPNAGGSCIRFPQNWGLGGQNRIQLR